MRLTRSGAWRTTSKATLAPMEWPAKANRAGAFCSSCSAISGKLLAAPWSTTWQSAACAMKGLTGAQTASLHMRPGTSSKGSGGCMYLPINQDINAQLAFRRGVKNAQRPLSLHDLLFPQASKTNCHAHLNRSSPQIAIHRIGPKNLGTRLSE